MIIPPSRDDAVAWSHHVSKLLGPPIEIDFEKEPATRLALRKGFTPRVVPSDDQYRYLWRHESTKRDTEPTATKKDDCASFISSEQSLECSESCQFSSESATLEASSRSVENEHTNVETTDVVGNASFVTPMSSQASRASRTCTGSKKRSNDVTHDFSGRQTRICTNRGGWISRSNFYKDGGVPPSAASNQQSRVDEPLSQKANAIWNVASGINQGKFSGERNHDCPTRNEARDSQIKTPDPTFEKEKNAAQAKFSSPEDNFITEQSKERKRSLFRPTAKRANQRLKQVSLRHMFGSL